MQVAPGSSHAQQQQHAHANGHAGGHGNPLSGDALENFAYTGEMGPVADISTFPPTMAPTPAGMDMNMLSMDSILTSEFWDSVLVPGALALSVVEVVMGNMLM